MIYYVPTQPGRKFKPAMTRNGEARVSITITVFLWMRNNVLKSLTNAPNHEMASKYCNNESVGNLFSTMFILPFLKTCVAGSKIFKRYTPETYYLRGSNRKECI